MNNAVFCIIKPDALVSGKVDGVIGHLKDFGYRIADFRVCFETHARQFEMLYEYNRDKADDPRVKATWWLHSEYFTKGPVITVLATDDSAEGHTRMAGLKGPADPRRRRPGQLRYELGATNLMMNLLHSADDQASSLREYQIFHSAEDLRLSLSRIGQRNFLSDHELESKLSPLEKNVLDLDFINVLLRLKLRIRQVLRSRHHLAGDETTDSIYASYADLIGSRADRITRLKRLRELMAAEMRTLRDLAAFARLDGLPDLLLGLAWIEGLDGPSMERLIDSVRAQGIHISSWERLVLLTSFYFEEGHTAHVEGEVTRAPVAAC